MEEAPRKLSETLVLDEFFALRLYERLRQISTGSMAEMLDRLVVVEARHYHFWQTLFALEHPRLNLRRRLKLEVIVGICRVFGPSAVHLTLEGIEIFGIRKYLTLWDVYKETSFGAKIKEVLQDEFEHEDEIVTGFGERKINPERVRGIFLGFNDGLVEILGAVSGFYAALKDPRLVVVAGVSVAVAGALSMAAGAYASTGSEREIESVQKGKAAFLGQPVASEVGESSGRVALIVGVSYLFGAFLPMFPVLLGSSTPLWSVLGGALAATIVSAVLAFLSGMNIPRRVFINLSIMGGAVLVSYAIGSLAHRLWGLSL